MKHTVTRVGPLSVAKILGALYGSMGALFIPFFLLPSLLMDAPTPFRGFSLFFLAAPLIYGGMGFVMGALMATIYNFFAARLGGLEVEVEGPSESAS